MPRMYKLELLPGCGTHFVGVDANGKKIKATATKDKGAIFLATSDLSKLFVNKFRFIEMVNAKDDDPLILENKVVPPPMNGDQLAEEAVEGDEGEETSESLETAGKELSIKKAKKKKYRVFLIEGSYVVTQEDGTTEVARYENKKAMLEALSN